MTMDKFLEVPIEQIEWPDSLRGEISEKDIDDMAKSFLASDQIMPIVVEEVVEIGPPAVTVTMDRDQIVNVPTGEYGLLTPQKYIGRVGRLRFEGAKRAHRNTIYARIHRFSDDSDRQAWQLIENLVRRDLNPLAIGEGYRRFKIYCEKELGGKYDKDVMGAMQKKVHESSGVKGPSDKTIYKYIQFAEEIPEAVKTILKSLACESFGQRHAEQLLRLTDDPETMLECAELIKNEKLTSAQLKTLIDDHLTVNAQASEPVRNALENKEIDLKSAAAISEVSIEMQLPILKMAKQGLKSGEVKKVIDFVETHEGVVDDILSKSGPEAVSVAEGKSTLKTSEEVEAFFKSKELAKVETYLIPCTCPNCSNVFKSKITVDWEHGKVTWNA